MSTSFGSAPQLGGKVAIVLFICTLLSFVIESQLTQYVQTTLEYRHPYFLLYTIHGSFWIIFPLHFIGLTVFGKASAADLWDNLKDAISQHLTPADSEDEESPRFFPITEYLKISVILTVAITLPALLWFAAVSLAPLSDVTALWNASAFFTYIFTVKLFGLKWEPRRLLAVVIATIGSMIVVYGGSTSSGDVKPKPGHESSAQIHTATVKFPSALFGDFLTLIASVGYGLYQVIYKKYAALPNDPEAKDYDAITTDDSDENGSSDADIESAKTSAANLVPFGLHANMVTSTIGLLTLTIFWIPLPFLHYSGVEPFALPPNLWTVISIAGIALSGVCFNAGFMVLLGLWGPIITSVGNLLTIVLVFISDITFGAGLETLTLWGTLGCGLIVTAFAVLAYDTFTHR